MRKIVPAIIPLYFSMTLIPPIEMYYESERQDISGMAELIEKRTKPFDILVFKPSWIKDYLSYYYPEIFRRDTRDAENFEELKEIIGECGSRRIWIIYLFMFHNMTDEEKLWLKENAHYSQKYFWRESAGAIFLVTSG